MTHCVVVFMAMIYVSERIQSKISRRKKKKKERRETWGKAQRKPGSNFQKTSLSKVTQKALNSPGTEV